MKKAPQRSGHILTSLTKSIKNGDMPLQEAEQASTRAFCISETIQYNGVYNGW